MAQLVFSEIGARIGAQFLPEGLQFLGQTISGAEIGQGIGAFVGSRVDQALAGPVAEGRRLDGLTVLESREGAGIPRAYGRTRIGGQVIWATHLKETKSDRRVGGKTGPRVSEYSYTISFAVALCEGEITSLDRIWANGEPVSLAGLNTRLYRGTEDQLPDPLIEAVEGSAPAYRGLAYLVFEDFPLDVYGARLPQLSFEVTRPVPPANGVALGELINSVNFIPASGEWVYDPTLIRSIEYPGWEETRNRNSATGEVDVIRALDQLQTELPNLSSLNLTLAWFGTDLRAGACEVKPGVETRDQINLPRDWSAGDTTREMAHLISRDEEGRPYYGGTPDDQSVLNLLSELHSRGIEVAISPFLLMDIPPGNGLSDPYGGTEQSAFPWRGRMTSTGDKTALARSDVAAFFGSASASDFSLSGSSVIYSGPAEWSYRRFVLHLAMLAKAAGTGSRFLLGSELVSLTRLRDEEGAFPAVEQLISLAAEVRTILGQGVEISYAADWTEYGAYVPDDGSGDVLFPLDPLWADANTDFIGVDWYAPLSDWRGGEHLDAADYDSIYDPDYLIANIEGGEGYDWYYQSPADRDAQVRTPITDIAHGEDWVFRVKDLRGWWSHAHHARPLGVRSATPTAFIPQSKPIRLIEIGCGAVDKGSNAPNVFYDPKSAESGLPFYSDGTRDDAIQAASLAALCDYWAPTSAHNPVSSVYSGPMIPGDGLSVWAYDARPFPAFPLREDIWSDGANWPTGHWINGRLSRSDLAGFIHEACSEVGVSVDVSGVTGSFHGFSAAGLTTIGELIAPLASVYGVRCTQSESGLVFSNTDTAASHTLTMDDFALPRGRNSALTTTRQLTDHAPKGLRLTLPDPDADYQPASYHRGEAPEGDRDLHIRLPLAMTGSDANALADHLYAVTNAAKLEMRVLVSPARVDVSEGDLVTLPGESVARRVGSVDRSGYLSLSLIDVTEGFDGQHALAGSGSPPAHVPRPELVVLDLPSLPGREDEIRPLVGASANPWLGQVSVLAGYDAASLTTRAVLTQRAIIGRLVTELAGGPGDRIRPGLSMDIEFPEADLSSVSMTDLLNGQNSFAIETSGGWMVMGFQTASQINATVWRVSGLLTGLSGTEDLSQLGAAAGARIVVLDDALQPADLADQEISQTLLWQGVGPGAEADAISFETVLSARALAPLRPAHLKARALPNGDIELSWTRRARHSADRLDMASVPLLEETEAYQINIREEGDIVRTVETSDTYWTYTSAMQTGDEYVGGSFTCEVAQNSARIGAGVVAMINI